MNKIKIQTNHTDGEEEPYVGMSISSLNRNMNCRPDPCDMGRRPDNCDMDRRRDICKMDPLAGMPLAMAYVPWQQWCETYEPAEGWRRGTIFPELDLPFLGGGAF